MEISTEKSRLDTNYIIDYLSKESYWAKGRSKERILKAIEGSLCFGIYLDDKQIGFARVVSDFSVFAWIMDVFIDPKHRSKGYGKSIMKTITNHPNLQTISQWGLNTIDVQGLYEQFGFEKIKEPEI